MESETREAARRWAATWARAWGEHDPDALRAVYAEDCTFRSDPFRDALHGPDGVVGYARWAFEDEASADPWFGEPVVDGDAAAVEWRTTFVGRNGEKDTIGGCSILRFDASGLVADEVGYWSLASAVTEVPASPPG